MTHLTKSYSKVADEFDRKAKTYGETHSQKNTTMGLHETLRRGLVEKLVPEKRGKLLAVGCGTGWYSKRFSNRFSCYDIDISFKMLEECKENNLNVCAANGECLPFLNNSFDCVICINMFQYVGKPLIFFREIRRVTKENGILIIDFKNKLSLRSLFHSINNKWPNHSDSDLEKRYSIFEIFKFLAETNWTLCKCVGTEFDCFQTSLTPKPSYLINFLKVIDKSLGPSPLKYFSGRLMLALK